MRKMWRENGWCMMSVNVNSLRDGSCPCANCSERKVGCHASCGSYKDWVESRKALRDAWWEKNGGAYEAGVVEIKGKSKICADKHRRRRR